MRRHIYLLAALAAASLASASAQTSGGGGSQGTGSQGTQAQGASNQGAQGTQTPSQRTQSRSPATTPPSQQTVRPPDPATNTSATNPTTQQQRIPHASRGVGTANRPNCSNMKGLEKAECERRDTSRDDLPAGVTTTQPKNPPQ
jgi:hypothetical protein